jgi:hypothetical protein
LLQGVYAEVLSKSRGKELSQKDEVKVIVKIRKILEDNLP